MDTSHHHIDFLIIGGGLAGLSAANHFADLQKNALLVEAGTFPMHKVCGEFISPEAIEYLKKWDIESSQSIKKISFFSGDQNFSFSLAQRAGSFSRFQLDHLLAQRLERLKIPVFTSKRVLQISQENGLYIAELSTGETITAKNVIMSTGRVPFKNDEVHSTKFSYYGIKAHFSGINMEEALEMYLFPGAYLGVSNVGEGIINIACIVESKIFEKYTSADVFMKDLFKASQTKRLGQILSKGEMIFPQWLETRLPEFSQRDTEEHPNVYFIGDSAGGIPPVTGNGLGMAIKSGIMAAEYALRGDSIGFRKKFRKQYRYKIYLGKVLHYICLHPFLGKIAIKLCRFFPKCAQYLFNKTR